MAQTLRFNVCDPRSVNSLKCESNATLPAAAPTQLLKDDHDRISEHDVIAVADRVHRLDGERPLQARADDTADCLLRLQRRQRIDQACVHEVGAPPLPLPDLDDSLGVPQVGHLQRGAVAEPGARRQEDEGHNGDDD